MRNVLGFGLSETCRSSVFFRHLTRHLSFVLVFCNLHLAAQSPAAEHSSLAPATTASTLPALHWKSSSTVHIELVSDSTVASGSGWGDGFLSRLKSGAEGLNLAAGGRSTKTFASEGRWSQALALKPDYMLYGFGHNDANKEKLDRYVTILDFRAAVEAAVNATQAAGIKIILMTCETERNWDAQGNPVNNPRFAPYDDVLREVAKERHLPMFDVEHVTKSFVEAAGKKSMDAVSQTRVDGSIDNIHVTAEGGMLMGRAVAEKAKLHLLELAPYLQ